MRIEEEEKKKKLEKIKIQEEERKKKLEEENKKLLELKRLKAQRDQQEQDKKLEELLQKEKEAQKKRELEEELSKKYKNVQVKRKKTPINKLTLYTHKSKESAPIYYKISNKTSFNCITNPPYIKKPYIKDQVVYNPKKALRGRSIEKFSKSSLNTSNQYTYTYTNTNMHNKINSNSINDLTISFIDPLNLNKSYKKEKVNSFSKSKISFNTSGTMQHTSDNDFTDFSKSKKEHQIESSLQINLEDLMILEEKLSEIITSLNSNRHINNECFEFWNFYFNCSLYKKIELAFITEASRSIIEMCINNTLLSIIICYDVSFNPNLLLILFLMIKEVLNLNHENLTLICEYILSKVANESLNNIWVYKLRNLVNKSKHKNNSNYNGDYDALDINTLTGIERIHYNTNCISSDIKIIIKNYPNTNKSKELFFLFKTLNKKSYEEINDFFRRKILRVDNPNASVVASVVLRQCANFPTVKPPYLKNRNLKPFTLVLDLDETIIHFIAKNEREGILKVRPGIFNFLETLGKYYELVIFTAATQEYADLLINNIDRNNIYFDYRLYRQHAVIIDDDFVKDLTRLGRPLDKVIIVDNMPQNFRLQKENGINIRAYWGEDENDTALIDLMHILVNIAKEGGDVRIGLAKYRDDIVKKVTTNISKHNY